MNHFLIIDGGMGTMLQEAGLQGGELPESWNLLHPERVKAIHQAYLDAGADVITANTFGANAYKLKNSGYTVEQLVSAGIRLAKEAVAESGKAAQVALDIGSIGQLLQPMGMLAFEEAVTLFAQLVRAGADAGADIILIETMSDLYEAKAAVLAAKENCSLPVWCSMTFTEADRSLTGSDVQTCVAVLEGLRVDALGLNCGRGPQQCLKLAQEFVRWSSLPVIVQPNAGLPQVKNGQTFFDVGPADFATQMADIATAGACILGGCCGTTPAHIAQLRQAVSSIPFQPPVPKTDALVSACSKTVVIGGRPLVIGERINPTGKKKFKEALRNHDMDYILDEAFAQMDLGSDVLDVNVGIPDIDEPAMMEEAVQQVQAIASSVPLQIDSSDPETIARALRIYNGKPIINAVNGKREVMDAIFPLAAKYGGVVIGLCLDETGIPATAEERLAIARRIVETAAAYGIAKKDLLIDTLVLTASAQQKEVIETIRALRLVREELGAHTVLGVSNVSFGLPARPTLNATFLAMALTEGLSCCIINPKSKVMMDTLLAFNVLANHDTNARTFIGTMQDAALAAASSAPPQAQRDLCSCIEMGLTDDAAQAAAALLDSGTDAMALVEAQIIPALNRVGDGFEKGTLFLPQLIQSAEAAKSAFSIIKERTAVSGQTKGEPIVIATVEGDVHDIGKNIVKLMLENYGYQVIDLGKNVPPAAVVEAVQQHGAHLAGLSALMTTTVVNMERTIALLHQQCPGCQVMVGGAVLTADYAAQIGADFYAADALASVSIAQTVFTQKPEKKG